MESPDSFYPSKESGRTLMRYSENNLVAATAQPGPVYRTVVLGFPFETIKGAEARNSLMKQTLDFLNNK